MDSYTIIFYQENHADVFIEDVPKKLVESSSVFTNLIEDTSYDNSKILLPLPKKYETNMILLNKLFEILEKLIINKMSITELMKIHYNDYIESFSLKNIESPFQNHLDKISSLYSVDKLKKLIIICDFLDIQSMIYVLSLIIASKIKCFNK